MELFEISPAQEKIHNAIKCKEPENKKDEKE